MPEPQLPPSPPPKATLLGLPLELRRQIYDVLLEQNANCYVSSLSPEGEAPEAPAISAFLHQPPLNMPLASLATACSSLADEVRSHILALPADKRVAAMELTGDQIGLKQCFFHRMPCRVVDLTSLQVHFNIVIGGDGHTKIPMYEWPNTLACDVVIALRQLFHRRRGLLKRAYGIKDVQVCLDVSKCPQSTLSDNGFRELAQEIRFILDTALEDSSCGKLFGERNVRLLD